MLAAVEVDCCLAKDVEVDATLVPRFGETDRMEISSCLSS